MQNKVAILILAHHNPNQLNALINHFQTDFDIYVQIDKKSALEIEDLPKFNNVYYYKNINVYWGDFSLVLNMYSVLKQAYLKSYDRYCFISGDDLPIKNNAYIKDFFEKNKQKIYMGANKLPSSGWDLNGGLDRLDRYWFMGFENRNFVKILGKLTYLAQKLLNIKIKRFPIDYYGGSQWLNLTHESLDYLFDYLDKNPNFFKNLRYSRAVDEIWVQSILMNSYLKECVIQDDLRYTDWLKGPTFPRVLDETDEDSLKKSQALFARKFNIKGGNISDYIKFLTN